MTIRLTRQEISSHGNLGSRLKPDVLAKFKAKAEGGCDLLHLAPGKGNSDVYIRPAGDGKLQRTQLPDWLESNQQEGPEGLTVNRISDVPYPTIYVSSIEPAEMQKIAGMGFEQLAESNAFVLGINLHVITKKNGDEVLLTKRGIDGKLTMAVTDLMDASLLRDEAEYSSIWPTAALSRFQGAAGSKALKYLGVTFDLFETTGHVGIIGVVSTDLSTSQVCEAMGPSMGGIELTEMSAQNVSQFLDANRAEMTPQLITGLTSLGYIKWRGKFFE